MPYVVIPRPSDPLATPARLWPGWPDYALRLIFNSTGIGDLRRGYFVRVPSNLAEGQHYLELKPGEGFTAHPHTHDTGYTWEQLTAYASGRMTQVSSPETAVTTPQPPRAIRQVPVSEALPSGPLVGIFPSVESVVALTIPIEARFPNLYAR